ncbi:DUF2812 domain-containing protein [Clostridium sartagoforme]|uniref:DUF2812 domain-containing protein n=1 Tax=Clostridium sartagoforme TaxID=84031 RepID=A0A4S2DMD6_9CLOT|nr:DUF2812 domain-containing protein [Clostridium sartagoforme]TGY43488.1 DUF2812 domain-containing protein [Clostridium sartagoforme]
MIFRDSKWVIFDFLPYEYKSLEEYLEKMASKGWLLQYMKGYILKFRKANPKKVKYAVDIMDSISFLDGKNSEKALEYREYCKEAGWNFVCESDKIQIYSSEENMERIEIHTDEREKFKIIRKASFKYILLKILTVITLLYGQYIITIGSIDGHFLASQLSLGSLLFIIIFAIHEIIGLITFIIFAVNGKKSLGIGRKINYNFKRSVKIKQIISIIGFLILALMIIVYGFKSDIDLLKILIIFLIFAIILEYVISFVKNRNYKNRKIIIPLIYLILPVIIAIVMMTTIFSNAILDSNNKKEISKKDFYLTLEDFNDSSKDDNLYYIEDKSPIASYLFYSVAGKKNYLSYDIFESDYKWVVKYNFNKRINFVREIGIDYIEKETNLPKDIKVFMNERGDKYIFISDYKMVEISTLEEISEDELISVVYEKLFK